MSGLADMRVVVTGGSSGIGRATVEMLLARGASVTSLDRDAPATSPSGPGGFRTVLCDVGDAASVDDAVAQAAEAMGGVDGVVNNAGRGSVGTVESTPDADWSGVFEVNVMGVVRVTRAAMPHLRLSRHPSVVSVGSIAGWTGLAQRAAYSASKGAVHALTLAMAADHVREGIRVNAVLPGTADTPWVQRLLAQADDPAAALAALRSRQPTGELVTAEQIAHAVCYLLDPQAGSTTGTLLQIDGGSHSLVLPPRPA